MAKVRVALLALLALGAPRAGGFFLDPHPRVWGGSYSFSGRGERPDGAFFAPGDVYTDVTLENWDLYGVGALQLPPTVQRLTLARCNLSEIPAEVFVLEQLQELSLPYNRLDDVEGVVASAATLTKLNVSNNVLTEYNVSLPALTSLDLSSNTLTAFPSAVFTSAVLDSLFMTKNEFQIVSMTTAQFDFFAGLSELQVGFADVTACEEGTLVYLKGRGVCRLDVEAASDPGVVPRDHSTPAPTVGVIIPGLPPNADSSTTKKFLTYAVIILIIGGAAAAVTALVSLGVVGGIARAVYDYIFKKRSQRYREVLHEETPLFFDNDKRADYQKELAVTDRLFPSNDPILVTWRIDYDAVALVQKLSQGAFGEVWIGKYRGHKVAVKRLLQDQVSVETSENFLREIKLMAWLEHPKIVRFIGVAWTKLVDMLAVIEYMDRGDLRSFLEANPGLSWKYSPKLEYAIDAIDAIVYLHSLSPVIIHRDLKSRNILLDSKNGAKLGDFGVSATKRAKSMTTGVGTARWLAPELARGEERYTEAVDIYAFGVILSELDTHQLPFADATNSAGEKLSDFAILQGVATETLEVSFSDSCPPRLLDLARRCVAFEPKDRPSAAEVAYELRKRDILL